MREKIGWGLLFIGGGLAVAEGLAQADATLNNIPFNQTGIGKLVAPIESKLPVSLGWMLLFSGAAVLWLLPLITKGEK